jgi:hypothetical protein
MLEHSITKRINYKYGETIKLKPIYDLHRGATTCDLKAFKNYIKEFDANTYFFTGGDLWDSIYWDDKRFKQSGSSHPDGDDPIDQEIEEMAVEILAPIKDRILAIGHGNHEETVVKRHFTNPSKRLAKKLNVPYGGYSYWLTLILSEDGGRGRIIDGYVSHGFGGGTRTEGGSITKYSRFADRIMADFIVFGHDHRKQYVEYPLFALIGEHPRKLTTKSKMVCIAGSWKKAFSNTTDSTWEESRGFAPAHIGGIEINIKPKGVGFKISVTM